MVRPVKLEKKYKLKVASVLSPGSKHDFRVVIFKGVGIGLGVGGGLDGEWGDGGRGGGLGGHLEVAHVLSPYLPGASLSECIA